MSSISFFGDMVVRDTDGLLLDDNVKEIMKASEYNIVNFEAPIANNHKPIPKSGPNNVQSKQAPSWAVRNGFNVFSFANNHSLDYGPQGLFETKESFPSSSILIGAGSWDEAYQPLLLTLKDGSRIGIVTGTHHEFGVLDETMKTDGIGCAWLMHPRIIENILSIRNKVDFLYVYAHTGVEFMEQPLPEFRCFFKYLIDVGCDGIINSHPHIPMGYEIYKGKPIVYSLGNFCFQKPGMKECDLKKNWNNSLCCHIKFKEGKAKLTILPLNYNLSKKSICVSHNEAYINYLDSVNRVLKNTDDYNNYVDSFVASMYLGYLSMLGVAKPRIRMIDKLRTLKRRLFSKDAPPHKVNTYQKRFAMRISPMGIT